MIKHAERAFLRASNGKSKSAAKKVIVNFGHAPIPKPKPLSSPEKLKQRPSLAFTSYRKRQSKSKLDLEPIKEERDVDQSCVTSDEECFEMASSP